MLRSIGHWIPHGEVGICNRAASYLRFILVNHVLSHTLVFEDRAPVWWCLDLDLSMLWAGWPMRTVTAGIASFSIWKAWEVCVCSVWFVFHLFCFQARYCRRRVLGSQPGNSRCLSGVSPGSKHLYVEFCSFLCLINQTPFAVRWKHAVFIASSLPDPAVLKSSPRWWRR